MNNSLLIIPENEMVFVHAKYSYSLTKLVRRDAIVTFEFDYIRYFTGVVKYKYFNLS